MKDRLTDLKILCTMIFVRGQVDADKYGTFCEDTHMKYCDLLAIRQLGPDQ